MNPLPPSQSYSSPHDYVHRQGTYMLATPVRATSNPAGKKKKKKKKKTKSEWNRHIYSDSATETLTTSTTTTATTWGQKFTL